MSCDSIFHSVTFVFWLCLEIENNELIYLSEYLLIIAYSFATFFFFSLVCRYFPCAFYKIEIIVKMFASSSLLLSILFYHSVQLTNI